SRYARRYCATAKLTFRDTAPWCNTPAYQVTGATRLVPRDWRCVTDITRLTLHAFSGLPVPGHQWAFCKIVGQPTRATVGRLKRVLDAPRRFRHALSVTSYQSRFSSHEVITPRRRAAADAMFD